MNIGMNFHSPKLANPNGLLKLDLRWGLFLLDPEEPWNSTIQRWLEVKALCPRCEPVVRFYRPNIMGESPEFRAKQFCDILTEHFGDQPVDAICMNEPDQAIEHGGQDYHYGGHIFQWNEHPGLSVIAGWLSHYADAHKAIRPQDPIHLPAPSAGLSVRTYFDAMWHTAQKYPVRDVHIYTLGQFERVWIMQNEGAVFVSEAGLQNGSPEDFVALAHELNEINVPFCIWKWNDKDDNPEGDPAGYAIADRPDVIDVLAKYAEANVDNTTPENDEVVDGLPIQEEEGNMSSELRRQWLQEYAAAHNGLFPTDWEFHKHELAIDANLPVTQADLDAVQEDLRSAERQHDMIATRLEGGSAPAPFLGG